LSHPAAFLLHGYHALLILSRHAPTANHPGSLFLSCHCYHYISAASGAPQRWHKGEPPVYEQVNQNLGTRDGHFVLSRTAIIHLLSPFLYCAASADLETVSAQSTCADLRYSITHEKHMQCRFSPIALAYGLRDAINHISCSSRTTSASCANQASRLFALYIGSDSLVYQPCTNTQVNETTWSRHCLCRARDRAPLIKLQSCHAAHASMCTGPKSRPGNKSVVV
jgi:hypothetical protein